MTETHATSFPELSYSPWFERKWSSLYEALHGEADGVWNGTDAKGRPMEVIWWNRLYIKQAR